MAIVYFMIGISGSGKSTWARNMGIPTVSSDGIREMLYGDESIQVDHARVFEKAHNLVLGALRIPEDVIFDATNVTSWSRRALLDKLPESTKKIAVVFNVTPEEALKRQKNRNRKVPKDVVERQWQQFCQDFDNIADEFDDVIEVY